ncbi:MAG: ABC transporter permease [Actinomycetota bacterium]|nr:ABC transporter permease [Actinomycetota bacterium]
MSSGPATKDRTPVEVRLRRVWVRSWPPLLGLALFLLGWQVLYLAEWRPSYVFPPPSQVFASLGEFFADPTFWRALGTTLTRGVLGFGLALLIGTVLGVALSRSRVLRSAVGSLLTGLQTMPSIAWFPFAILLYGPTEQAILFVVILGAVPSIANGLISGIDDVPPALVRTAYTLGARGMAMYRYVIVPAALPTYVAGLKQGWAFAWRSLMAGELLVIIAARPSLGVQMTFFREFADTASLLATMVVILVIGMLVDGVLSKVSNRVRVKRGLGAVRL